jgi:antitoxin VapB
MRWGVREEGGVGLFPLVTFESICLPEANELLVQWGHRMGALNRPCFGQAEWCHVLRHGDEPMAVTVASRLITPQLGPGMEYLTRESACELSRLCACRPGLCRVALRLWREFVFPEMPFEYAISYQDANLHSGNTYRFDGWQCVGASRSGSDARSGRRGRSKRIWQWPPKS